MSVRTSTAIDVREALRDVVAAAEDRKATDVKAIDLTGVSDFTDFFVLCSGRSERQVQAIAEAIKESLAKAGLRPIAVEGLRQARWVLMDYGDFVVHVFERETRAYYGLERLWTDAPDVTDSLR